MRLCVCLPGFHCSVVAAVCSVFLFVCLPFSACILCLACQQVFHKEKIALKTVGGNLFQKELKAEGCVLH